jgi:hypothetical protein
VREEQTGAVLRRETWDDVLYVPQAVPEQGEPRAEGDEDLWACLGRIRAAIACTRRRMRYLQATSLIPSECGPFTCYGCGSRSPLPTVQWPASERSTGQAGDPSGGD